MCCIHMSPMTQIFLQHTLLLDQETKWYFSKHQFPSPILISKFPLTNQMIFNEYVNWSHWKSRYQNNVMSQWFVMMLRQKQKLLLSISLKRQRFLDIFYFMSLLVHRGKTCLLLRVYNNFKTLHLTTKYTSFSSKKTCLLHTNFLC